MQHHSELYHDALHLLDQLIATPSVSRNEDATADVLMRFLLEYGVGEVHRLHNNVWVQAALWDDHHPTLLLNSHHDTVPPSASYTRDPHMPAHEDGRVYGLGSNDAGASVVSLVAAFRHFYQAHLPFNLLLAITAEEEITGPQGIRALLPTLGRIDMGIVGEPTSLQAALGERGLVVLDGVTHGLQGHAARNEGINALYLALDDINALRQFKFDKQSSLLGDIKVSVTQINAGTKHNVVPATCQFVADVRTTDAYTNEETVRLLQAAMRHSTLTPRSTRIRASSLHASHPLAQAASVLHINSFVSPTTSDMSQMPFPTLKLGPGDSARSHTANEWVAEADVANGIDTYIRFISELTNFF